MSSDDVSSIVIMFLLLFCSAYFSATETAFSSLSRARMKTMAEAGNKRAKKVMYFIENFDQLLSTVLVGNNLVNIIMTTIATICFVRWFAESGATISTVVVTLVVLLFGEITPKSLAKECPEQFAMFSVPIISLINIILIPTTFFLGYWKRLIHHFVPTDSNRGLTEDELITIIEEAEMNGGIDEQESELIRSAIEFNEVEVSEILTPRVNIIGISLQISESEIGDYIRSFSFSRLPVYDGSIDNIVGILRVRDYYERRDGQGIKDIMSTPLFMPESAKIGDILKLLQTQKTNMAIITDEYGGTMGIVTIEDIVEELVGEIWDEYDNITPKYEAIDEGHFRVLGNADIDVLEDLFELDLDDYDSKTVGGWVAEQIERIPKPGEELLLQNISVVVLKADKRRIIELELFSKIKGSNIDETENMPIKSLP